MVKTSGKNRHSKGLRQRTQNVVQRGLIYISNKNDGYKIEYLHDHTVIFNNARAIWHATGQNYKQWAIIRNRQI